MAPTLIPLFIFFLFFLLSSAAKLRPSQTFSYSNSGEFGLYIAEYGATYRDLPIAATPYHLCFFNTTPGSFYLALRIGTRRSESIFRFVWTANPSRPVGENATFSLLPDGDLRLTDADGFLAFSSRTAGESDVVLSLFQNGNLVLTNSRVILWQSFGHPSDSLLVGQSLPAGKKLVSRGPAGRYSLEADSSGVGLYVKTELSGSVLYSTGDGKLRLPDRGRIEAVTFGSAPETAGAYAFELGLELQPGLGNLILARPKYNATISFLRVEDDGDLVVYTYYDPVDYGAWEKTFALFSAEKGYESGCRRPAKCGDLGVCQAEMCVACPTASGLAGWTAGCAPPARRCEGRGFYKVEGVETFVSRHGAAPLEGADGVKECFTSCLRECSCAGVLHWEKEFKCWLLPAIGSPAIGALEKVEDESHVVWIRSRPCLRGEREREREEVIQSQNIDV